MIKVKEYPLAAMKYLLVLMVLLIAAAVTAPDASALVYGDYEYTIANNEATITKYTGSGGDVVVPATINGCKVVKIGNNAFNCSWADDAYLTSVVLPESIRSIGSNAFSYQATMTKVNIPAGCSEIEQFAFFKCNIERLSLSGTNVNGMSLSVFRDNDNLKSVVIGEGATNIPHHTFDSCESLASVTLPSTLTTIGEYAFDSCTSLTNVVIPAAVTRLNEFAFNNCTSLSNITFAQGSKLTRLENWAFSKCSMKELYLPRSLQFIGDHVFDGCKNLTGIVIPTSVTKLGMAFWNDLPNLLWVSVGANTSVSEYGGTFEGCSNAIVYCQSGSSCEKACAARGFSYISDKSASAPIQVIYNGMRVAFGVYGTDPQIINNRTMVPLRSIFEAMGAEVGWDNATRTVLASRGNTSIKLAIGSNTMYVNGRAVVLDSPAVIVNDRTVVPIRAVAEAFGANVDWNDNGRLVLIKE